VKDVHILKQQHDVVRFKASQNDALSISVMVWSKSEGEVARYMHCVHKIQSARRCGAPLS
jgi:hypothetical protein